MKPLKNTTFVLKQTVDSEKYSNTRHTQVDIENVSVVKEALSFLRWKQFLTTELRTAPHDSCTAPTNPKSPASSS